MHIDPIVISNSTITQKIEKKTVEKVADETQKYNIYLSDSEQCAYAHTEINVKIKNRKQYA